MLTDEAAVELSTRSRGTPRIANRLLRRVRDYAEVRADGVVTGDVARTALEIYEVDEHGLDRLDRGVLEAVVRRFGGGPVGPVHAGGGAGGGGGDRRGGRRAVPGPVRAAGADPARPGGHGGRMGSSGS